MRLRPTFLASVPVILLVNGSEVTVGEALDLWQADQAANSWANARGLWAYQLAPDYDREAFVGLAATL